MAYVAAIVGFTLCVLTVLLCSQIEGRMLRFGVMVPALGVALAAAALVAGNGEDALRAWIVIAAMSAGYALAFARDETAG